jgi:hypothetical protein
MFASFSNQAVRLGLWAAALAVVGSGCTSDLSDSPFQVKAQEKGAETKQMPWTPRDAPSIFSNDLVYKLDELPMAGEASNIPWASSYWPVYQDSLNYKWDGQDSMTISAKYGAAFGVDGVEDAVSRYHGVDSRSHTDECSETSECDSDLGERCSKRDGEEKGYCIPTWWGICHAWAPASILHPEPKHPVTINGVEFKVNDIKALVTLVHDRTVTKFVSGRCNDNDGADEIEYDEYGRPKSGQCIDTNPATLHILLANYLGLKGESFVEDRTFDMEVWNQPIRGYRTTRLREVTAEEANALVGATSAGGETSNRNGSVDQGAWQHFDAYTVEAGEKFKVTMGGDGDGDLYVRFGAQPTKDDYNCRPYQGGSSEVCDLTVPDGVTQAFVSVHGYSQSDFDITVTVGGGTPTEYLFNSNAERFYEVHVEVDYIAESSSGTDGNLADRIDNYTHTDRYTYILEVDNAGRLIGGEYTGASKKNHPDFLWLPIRASGNSVAGGKITYAKVKQLLDMSVVDENSGGEGDEKRVNESGTVTRGEFVHFGPFNVASGKTLKAELTGDGDADLYVRKGAKSTTTLYDCRPYKSGTEEECTVTGNGGEVWVSVAGYAATSNFALTVTYTESGDEPTDPVDPVDPPAEFEHLNVSGSVGVGEMAYHAIELEAGKQLVIKTQSSSDVDLYIQFGSQPSTSEYLKRAYTVSGNETLDFAAPSSGTLHIGVSGYEAGDYTLTTTDP